MKINLFIILFTLLFQTHSFAQNLGETTWGSWYEITSSNRLSNRISLSGSYTNWNYELPAKNTHLHLLILGVNYHFNNNVYAGLGYAYGNIDSTFEINDAPSTLEHRILEQVILKHRLFNLNWSHRFKLEHRFLEYPTQDILKHRLRYRLKSKYPFNDTYFLSFYDEIHFNLNEFDFQQNRAYLGLGINLNTNTNIDVGYARHSFKTKSFHRLSVQLNLKYDFRKKKS